MVDFAYMEQEKEYFEKIKEFFKAQYQEHLNNPTEDVEVDIEEFSRELAKPLGIDIESDAFKEFTSKVKEGFQKLAKEFESIDKKTKTADEAMKELGLSAKLDKLKREIDYEKNPTLMKGITNALKNFADHISESFCECFGKNKNEAVLLLTEAFKSQKSSIFKKVDKQSMAEGHVSALNDSEMIKENNKNTTTFQEIGIIVCTIGMALKELTIGRSK